MHKITFGPQTLVYPMPALLIGANVDGKANFAAVAWAGIANSDPPMISVSLRHHRHTLKGIRQTMTFSVNVPSIDMMKETDYCGIVTGSKADKAEVCKFKVFCGKLTDAPLIEQYPVNLECRVVHMFNLGSHTMVVGRIEETHVSNDCLSDGKPDVEKIRPFCYVPDPSRQYRAIGEVLGKAFGAGLELKSKE